MASCQPTVKSGVSGTLTGVESDSLLVMTYELGVRKTPLSDTLVLKNNKFSFASSDSVLQYVRLYPIPGFTEDGRRKAMDMSKVITLPVLPGKAVQINGSLDNYTVSGDVFYDELTKVDAMRKPFEAQLDSLQLMATQMQAKGVSRDSIMAAYAPGEAIFNKMNETVLEYIHQNPTSAVSLYLLSNMDMNIIIEEFGKLSENFKNGPWAPLYNTLKEGYDKEMARRQAAELVKEGCVAPDFTLKNLKGEEVSLSSLKGKVVVLDFWGSWCGWCIKGMPEMKKYYQKYHKKSFEILGIACNDTDKAWRQAVETHKLPWINVLNEPEKQVTVKYAITGFPTKFIIGKDGKILKNYVGEDPEFYTYLDSILK